MYFFTTVLSQWDFSQGKFGLLSPGKANCDRVARPNVRCMLGVLGVSLIHRTLTWTIWSLTCAQMLMHAIAHGGCRDTVRESALKVDSGRKIPCRTGESNLRQLRASPMLYQLSYIPAPAITVIPELGTSWILTSSPPYRIISGRTITVWNQTWKIHLWQITKPQVKGRFTVLDHRDKG